jgi:hypothetical protein
MGQHFDFKTLYGKRRKSGNSKRGEEKKLEQRFSLSSFF